MMNQNWMPVQGIPQKQVLSEVGAQGDEDSEGSRRPPNAFILYSKKYRSQVQQENPSMSNTEVSRLLGKMWKEVPNETKLQYKQKAAQLQEEFKKNNPNYTYRKARRKRALNDMLSKSAQNILQFPMDQQMWQYQNQKMYGMPIPGMPQFQSNIPQMPGIPQMQDVQQLPISAFPANYIQ